MPGFFASCIGKAVAAPVGTSSGSLRAVPSARLFVSEPDPCMFGNDRNPKVGSPEAKAWTNEAWLKSRFHFSFAEYSSGPGQFGVVRVMNDDLVQPDRGFGAHPHSNMEIVTFVVTGGLTHQDSQGNRETLGRGSVQFMTAGTGITHAEHNLEKTSPLHFIQTWILPRRRGLAPNYGSMVGDEAAAAARLGQWSHIVGDLEEAASRAPVQINQDCNVYVVELPAGATAPPLELRAGRQAYLLCVEGGLEAAGGQRLRQHDGAEVKGPMLLRLTAQTSGGAMALLFEMAMTADARRDV